MQQITTYDVFTLREFFEECLGFISNTFIEDKWSLIKNVALILGVEPTEFEDYTGFHWNHFDEIDIDLEDQYII